MRRYISFMALLLCISCVEATQTPDIDPEDQTTPQTTLMYLTGTELSYFFTQNIAAAKQGVIKDVLGDGRLLIFKHSSSTTGSLIELTLQDGACVETLVQVYDESTNAKITSLTADGFARVFADVVETAPADSYNLIISGHGTGWVPKTNLSTSWYSVDGGSDTSYYDMWKQDYSNLSTVTKYLGSTTDSLLDIEELHDIITETNTHFGYIIFDMCFMSSIEVLYSLRDLCDYIIASPCEIMGAGFPYNTTLEYLFTENGHSFDIEGICQTYYDYYSTYTYPSGCIAATVCSELEALASCVKKINALYSDDDIDIESIQPYERLANPLFLDLEDYILAKCEDATLAAEFIAQMERAFPLECRLHTPSFFANIGVYASSANNYAAYFTEIGDVYSGVSTSAPSSQFRTGYEQTSWCEATN